MRSFIEMRNGASSTGSPKIRKKMVDGSGTQNASCSSTCPSPMKPSTSSSASLRMSGSSAAIFLGVNSGSSSLR